MIFTIRLIIRTIHLIFKVVLLLTEKSYLMVIKENVIFHLEVNIIEI